MIPFLATYLANLRALNDELKALLTGIPTDALDWSPSPESNSLAVLAAHVAGAQSYWLGDVIAARPSRRDREGEFRTRDLDAVSLCAHLDASLDAAEDVLESFSLDALSAERVSPRHNRVYTVDWVLLHTLEHTAQHLGHAQLTRQLLEWRSAA